MSSSHSANNNSNNNATSAGSILPIQAKLLMKMKKNINNIPYKYICKINLWISFTYPSVDSFFSQLPLSTFFLQWNICLLMLSPGLPLTSLSSSVGTTLLQVPLMFTDMIFSFIWTLSYSVVTSALNSRIVLDMPSHVSCEASAL